MAYVFASYHLQDQSILNEYSVQKHGNLWKGQTPFVLKRKVCGHIMRLDDVWLHTILNTPNISGVWQIKKVVSCQFESPPTRSESTGRFLCFNFFFFVCLKHRQQYTEGTKEQVIENVKEIIVRRLGKFQKKHKTETSYDI